MKHLLALLIAVWTSGFTGCSTLQPGADPLVVNAERTIEVSRVTLDAFLKFEFSNRDKCPAQVQAAAEAIRVKAPEWFRRAHRVKLAYKQNRGPDQKADLLTALAVLQTAAGEAATALATYAK